MSLPLMVATDLDGTVVFSRRSMGDPPPPAERLRPVDALGAEVYGYQTDTVHAAWEVRVATGALIPVTTRSVQQYLRMRLPGPPPPVAVVCNGGRLLVDGVNDPAWEARVRAAVAGGGLSVAAMLATATGWHDRYGFATVRSVEDFFVYLTVAERRPWLTGFAAEAADWCRAHGWRASLQGRKLYLLPESLDKAPAVAEVAARLGAARVVAGGDSLLDARMLRAADAAVRPAHGELEVTGFTAPNCRTTDGRGAAAGDEIMAWYAEQLDAAAAGIGSTAVARMT